MKRMKEMKRMIRILMIAICCMLSCNMAANAGNDKPIAVNALPAKAQTLLSNHFNNQKVMLATIETGIINKSYDVVLQNGTPADPDNPAESWCGRHRCLRSTGEPAPAWPPESPATDIRSADWN